jgi:ABC-type polar amino acid transport system ATPase subunit
MKPECIVFNEITFMLDPDPETVVHESIKKEKKKKHNFYAKFLNFLRSM